MTFLSTAGAPKMIRIRALRNICLTSRDSMPVGRFSVAKLPSRDIHTRQVLGFGITLAAISALAGAAAAQDTDRSVAGGGIHVPGWQGTAAAGQDVNTAKLTKEGDGLHVVTG